MVKKSFLVLLLLLFVVTPLISSVPYQDSKAICFEEGMIVYLNGIDTIKVNQPFRIEAHVYNTSSGTILTNSSITCAINLHNPKGEDVYINTNLFYDSVNFDFEANFLSGNFSSIGRYPYTFACVRTNNVGGGQCQSYLEVTGSGIDLNTPRAITYSLIFFLFIFLFIIIMLGINKLPSGNDRDDNGQLMSINNLKYFRSVLLLFEYLIVVSLFFLASNLASAYLGEQLFFKFLFTIFQILTYLILPIILVWVVWIFTQIIDDKRMRKLIEHGIYEGKGGNL